MTNLDQMALLIAEIRAFTAEREWEQYHDPKNLAMALASEAGELLAELRWVHSDNVETVVREPAKRERILEELGDLMILLVGLCDRLGVDPVTVAQKKLARNAQRYPAKDVRGSPERPPSGERGG